MKLCSNLRQNHRFKLKRNHGSKLRQIHMNLKTGHLAQKKHSIIFDLYDTLIYSSHRSGTPFDTQAFINTFDEIDYEYMYNRKIEDIAHMINTCRGTSQYVQLYDILLVNDRDPKAIRKYIPYIDAIHKLFLDNQNKLLLDPNYYTIERNLYDMIRTIHIQGIHNMYAISKYNDIITSRLNKHLANRDIHIDKIINNSHIFEHNHILSLVRKYELDIPGSMLVSNNKKDISIASKYKIYTVGLAPNNANKTEFYDSGADYVINHICQLPYVLNKLQATY